MCAIYLTESNVIVKNRIGDEGNKRLSLFYV